jgi:3'(2'), 5'-bisphosphate nucleotidase
MPYEQELEVALQAAAAAGRLILDAYEHFTPIPNAPASISTQADRDSQECILQMLQARFPADAFCAEEATPSLDRTRTAPRTWVVDPIDGTRGFAQKNGEFSVMIGLVDRDQVVLGVVLEPASWRLTYAVRRAGCWRRDGVDGEPIVCRVSTTADLASATLVQSRTKAGRPWPHTVALAPGRVTETHSAGVKLARVARGEADLYVNHYRNFHDWDICAGHILVEEAGGRVTTFHGQPIRYGQGHADQRDGLLATNGLPHEEAMARLKGCF